MTQELKAPDFSDRYLAPREIVADRFEAGEKIGDGPFGQVYRAQDMLIEAEVALKVYGDDLMKNPLHEERFLKATRRARALTQKNVVRLHDGNIHNGHPWVSMQYLEGLNLRKVVGLRQKREESFGIAEIEPILAQITLALQHVGRDHPHGDLKPENIILMPDLIKVTDSYLMSAIPDDAFRKGNKDNAFVAPELLDDQAGEADGRCDVYSVGAIIGLLLFGEDYQPGSAKDAPGAMAAVDALCRRAMAFDRNERYGSVEALAEDFTAIVDTGSLLNQESTPARSVPKPPAPKPKSTKPAAPSPAHGEPAAVAAASGLAAEVSDAATTPDPLDVETAPDIGMPLEDDLPTEEYDREEHAPELADMLPTNEVDRDQFPAPKSEPPESSAPQQKAAEKEEPPEQEVAAATPPAARSVKESSAGASTTAKKDKTTGNRSGRRMGLAAIVIGIIFVIGLIGAGLMATVFSENEEETPQEQARAQEVEQDEQEPVADEEDDAAAADEAEDAQEEAEAQRLAAVGEAVVAAIAVPMEALDSAEEAAQSEAEELEEAQAEEEAEQEVARAGNANNATGSASSSNGGRAAAPATNCPGDMVRVTGGGQNVCLDAYQYPGRGRMPEVNVSWFDARRLCGQQDKRLCTQDEWRAGCGGSYPYGSSFDADRCNTVDADGFGRMPTETGSFPQCRSRAGAYDMSGNVFEWVAEERVVGGDSDSGADMATCGYSSAMSPSSSRGNVGFRCCADPT